MRASPLSEMCRWEIGNIINLSLGQLQGVELPDGKVMRNTLNLNLGGKYAECDVPVIIKGNQVSGGQLMKTK